MFWHLFSPILVFIFCMENVTCSNGTTAGDSWLVPVKPDFTTSFQNGSTIAISWRPDLWEYFATYAPLADVSDVDLWCMDWPVHQYGYMIAAQLAVNRTFTHSWTINIPQDVYSVTNQWVFRFLPHGTTLATSDIQNESVSSPGFIVIIPAASKTTLVTTSAPTPSSNTTTSDPPPIATSSNNATLPSNSAEGLSTGAKAGIGAGAGIGVIGAISIGLILIMKACKNNKSAPVRKAENTHCQEKSRLQEANMLAIPPAYTIVNELESPRRSVTVVEMSA